MGGREHLMRPARPRSTALLVLALMLASCASVGNDVEVTKDDMSLYPNDRQVCAWKSYDVAGCVWGGSICQGDPRAVYKACMYDLGYTVDGLKPPSARR
jgi:hypothetical protein